MDKMTLTILRLSKPTMIETCEGEFQKNVSLKELFSYEDASWLKFNIQMRGTSVSIAKFNGILLVAGPYKWIHSLIIIF